MNILELGDRLEQEGYSQNLYSFDLDLPPIEGFILEKCGTRWVVYFFERGVARDMANFESQSDACTYFYQMMQESYGSIRGKKIN